MTDQLVDPVTEPAPAAASYPNATSLGDLLSHQLATRPDSCALRFPDAESVTWREVADAAAGVQAGLVEMGVGPGDRVAIMCDNSLRTATAIVAVIAFGAVAVPVNTAMVGDSLRFILQHSEARLLIADPVYLSRCRDLGLTDLPAVAVSDESETETSWPAAFDRTGKLVIRGAENDPAQILYTSGTTGEPKGVVLSHRACLAGSWTSAAIMFEAGPDDVIFTCLPLFHCAAQQLGLWTALWSGAELVVAPKFSASSFWGDIRRFNVTAFHFIGPLLSVLWKRPPTPDDREHRVRRMVGGGPRVAWAEFEERFGVAAVECYGMTETFGGCITHRPGRGRLGTVGRAAEHVEVAVVDPAGELLGVGERGEVVIRARYPDVLFTEYLKRPNLTATAMSGGWYHTGDLGSFDEDGFLTFHSRLKEVLRHRGENVSVVEVEQVLTRHPQVADCAVVGVASPLGEDDILAAVVPTAGELDIPALLEFARTELPSFAVPRFVSIRESLPRTATDRLQRHLLTGLEASAYDSEPAPR